MKILLGVTGSIACYKSFDLARNLINKGFKVRVILTKGALNFIRPELFKYLGADEVYSYEDDFNLEKTSQSQSSVLHVELAKWADKIAIYPASANTISRMAMGQASDLLSSVYLAKREQTQTIIFPAMNTYMYTHPITMENMNLLQRLSKAGNTTIISPSSGKLICHDEGQGKLQPVEVATDLIETISHISETKKVLLTTGATIAPIDPVRYVTNPSSGLTGYELTKVYLELGMKVHVLAGKYATKDLENLKLHPNFSMIRLNTTEQMFEQVKNIISEFDIYISAAAISDINFKIASEKLKKKDLSGVLNFSNSPDILEYVVNKRFADKSPLKIVGFAAETSPTHEVLSEKWNRKKVDLLVGTKVHSGNTENTEQQGFGNDCAEYSFFKNGNISYTGKLTKKELSKYILKELQ